MEVVGSDDRFARQLVRVPQAISGGSEFGEEGLRAKLPERSVAELRIAETKIGTVVSLSNHLVTGHTMA